MGFFNKMFKSEDEIAKEEIKKVPWKELTNIEMLDEVTEDSKTRPVAILKHSTSCGISRMVLRQFEKEYDLKEEEVGLYFLDLLKHRDVSNKIASRYNIPHQSPQLIILRDGKVVYDASHSDISAEILHKYLN